MRALHALMEPNLGPPTQAQVDAATAHFNALMEQDLRNAEAGVYPRRLLFDGPPLLAPRTAAQLASELPRIWWRHRTHNHTDLPATADLSDYPPYYRRTFHWQTDGWLSLRSARLYDAQVELLFTGTADVMRRMSLPPLVESLKTHRRPRILDVGCGTGRFLWQLHMTVPRAKLLGIDLSPFYIQRAFELLHDVRDVSLLVDNAEAMPLANASADAVVSVFLFHELPLPARRAVLEEIWRVCAPGGHVVLCDAAQNADASDTGYFFDVFATVYHEPYFKSYMRHPLESLLRTAGFEVLKSQRWLWSKVVTARKPQREI